LKKDYRGDVENEQVFLAWRITGAFRCGLRGVGGPGYIPYQSIKDKYLF